jgi:hypothetical protein
VFRDDTTSPGSSQRPIMSASANVNLFLPAGTYWLVWALAGSRSDGPFVPPITIPNQTTTGNGYHLASTGWVLARDSGTNTQQGFPFVLEGSAPGGTGPGPSLTGSTNGNLFKPGDPFVLSATMTAGNSLVDVYVIFTLPSGAQMSLTPGGLVSGVVPYVRGITPFNYSGTLLSMPFPSGYPGATSTQPVSAISEVLFTVTI